MITPVRHALALLFTAAWLGACVQSPAPATAPSPIADAATREALQTNPLLAEWTGSYGGTPAFDKMSLADLREALEAGMAAHLAEIDQIASNPEAPTFANTIEAMERAGAPLDRAMTYYGIWSSNLSSPEFRAIQREIAPRLSAYNSKIIQNAALFARIDRLQSASSRLSLTPQQTRLLKLTHERFALNGAALNEDGKRRHAEINQELAGLHTRFANNLLADEEKYVTFLSADRAGGLPGSLVASARAEADARGRPGEIAITNTRSSMDPFLTFADDRAAREAVWRTYYSRGDNGDDNDNNALIARILQLRHERVGLLGFRTYADWRLQGNMARSPAEATRLMEAVWAAAKERVREEVADMQTLATRNGDKTVIEPWDYRYYAEKVRKETYALDSEEVKAYLQLDALREAMFFVAGELFNFRFTPVPEGRVAVFHPDVRVWEVHDRTSSKLIGLWYLDPYARVGKRSGAWATSYRSHSTIDGETVVLASNNSNFVKPPPGQPLLISFDDAETFFHEFGHALHALSSKVDYPGLNGGVRDYTEFQSQLLERWLLTDKVISGYLRHHQTGKAMPQELVDRILKASTFNQGFATVEFLGSAIMDMTYHSIDPTGLNPKTFEREELARLGMPPQIPMRHRSTQFGHVFSSEGYAAGYYGYLWADVLTSDAAEAFAKAPGGFYDKDMARKLVDNLFAVRNAVDPAEAYRAFRGRDASINALMRDRGFPAEP